MIKGKKRIFNYIGKKLLITTFSLSYTTKRTCFEDALNKTNTKLCKNINKHLSHLNPLMKSIFEDYRE